MVFKQLGEDSDKFQNKFGLFSKSFQDIKKDLSNGLGIKQGIFSLIKKEDIQSLNNFNKAIHNGTNYTEAFDKYLSKAPIYVKRQANELIKLTNQQNQLNSQYSEQIKAIQNLKREEAEEYVKQNQADYEIAKEYLQTPLEFEKTIKSGTMITKDGIKIKAEGLGAWSDTTLDAWNKLGFDNIRDPRKYGLSQNNVYVDGIPEEQYEALSAMADVYATIKGPDTERLKMLRDQANVIKEQIDGYKNVVNQQEQELDFINKSPVYPQTLEDFQLNFQFYELLDKAQEAQNEFLKAQEGNSWVAVGKATDNLNEIEEKLRSLVSDNTEYQSIVDELFDSFEGGANRASTSIEAMTAKFDELLEQLDTTSDNITSIEEALQTLSDGEALDHDSMFNILNLDTDGILKDITTVGNKYKLSSEELIQLKDSIIQKQIEQLEADKAEANEALETIKVKLSAAQAELDIELKTKKNSTGDVEILNKKKQALADIREEISGYSSLISKDTMLINELNSRLGDTVDKTSAIQNNIDKIQDDIDTLQKQADNLLKAQETKIAQIVDNLEDEKEVLEDQKKVLEEQLETLEAQQDEIEEIISSYEKVADIVSDTVQDEIDVIEEQRQSVENYYDDIINKLKDANEERQEAIDLAEKQAALENAKNNKVRVFDETRGWVYESNLEDVKNAENDLANAEAEAEISRLEKEKEATLGKYDEQIKALEEYAQQWSDFLESITDAENEALAEQILGVEWREKIKNKDTEILNLFKSNYNSYKTQLNNLINGEIADLNRSIKAKEAEIEAKEKQIESWKKYKTEIQNAANEISMILDDYISDLQQLTIDENSTYEERLNNFQNFVNSYSDKINQISAKNVELQNASEQLNALAENMDSTSSHIGDSLSYITNEMIDTYAAMQEYSNGISNEGVASMAKALRDTITGYSIANSSGDVNIINEAKRLIYALTGERYATGGVNSTTGLAWLDGTSSAAETIFNAKDSKKLYDLVHNSDSLVNVMADKISRSSFSVPSQAINNSNSKTFQTTINIDKVVSDSPQDFVNNMKIYLRRVSSEAKVF